MSEKAQEPIDLREVNEALANALLRARTTYLGLSSGSAMAVLMNEATGGEGPDISTYDRWEGKRRRVPGWALVVAAQVVSQQLGQQVTVSQLLEEPASDQPLPQSEFNARFRRLEREVASLGEIVNPLVADLEQRQRQRRRRGQAS